MAKGPRSRCRRDSVFWFPKKKNRPLLACTFVHKKFPYRAPEGKAMLRCFLGAHAIRKCWGVLTMKFSRREAGTGLDSPSGGGAVVLADCRGGLPPWRSISSGTRQELTESRKDGEISSSVYGRQRLFGNRPVGLHPDGKANCRTGFENVTASGIAGKEQIPSGKSSEGRAFKKDNPLPVEVTLA